MIKNLPAKLTLNILLTFLCATSFSQTTVSDSLFFEGLMRNYRVYIPKIYTASKAVPLVLNLHGLTSNAQQQELYADFRGIADTANFIIVHPDGTDGALGRGWNNFAAPGQGVNDLGFLSALIDKICTKYKIDQNRIYSTGMSNGGFMSYDLACFLSYRIAAIASVTGSMVPSHKIACDAKHPTPVMEIHGTSDNTVPYNGNGTIAFTHIDTLVHFWVKFNGCSAPVITKLPNVNTMDGCTVEHSVFSNGKNGSSVELYKVIGGGHSWPGTTIPIMGQATNKDFNASKEIWRFFSQYRLDSVTGIAQTVPAKSNPFIIYPNPASTDFEIISTDKQYTSYTIRIVNSIGQEVMQAKAENGSLHVARGNLSAGLYTVEIRYADISTFKKIIFN